MEKDYSIECALPYVDSLDGIKGSFNSALRDLRRDLDVNKKTYCQVLLVDDVTHDGGESYNLNTYTEASIGDSNHTAVIFRESMLNELLNKVYAELLLVMTPEQRAMLKNEHHYSSPFYIAVWTLVRLGYLSHEDFPPDQIAERVINILPAIFREGEEKSMNIVRSTQYSVAAERVDYIYI